ncbi:MAG: VOC family protein [Candidatus Bathyarchaeia archaeon]|nr:VOC family protein [Candidatus Bathyarchaeota archaeon]
MPKGMILEHVSMIVRNRDESVDFYTKVMGFKVLRKYETETMRVAYLYLDDQLLELNEMCPKDQPAGLVPLGLSHLGFRVDDMDEAISEFKKYGVEVTGEPIKFEPKIYAVAEVSGEKLLRALRPTKKPYWKIATLKDPNGVTIELLER